MRPLAPAILRVCSLVLEVDCESYVPVLWNFLGLSEMFFILEANLSAVSHSDLMLARL